VVVYFGFTVLGIGEIEFAGEFLSMVCVDAPGGDVASVEVRLYGGWAEVSAGLWVVGTFWSMGGVGDISEFFRDLFAATKTGIDDAEGFELAECLVIGWESVGLPQWRVVWAEGEIGEVVEDGLVVFFPRAGGIDILESEKVGAIELACEIVRFFSCVEVTEVEVSRGRWGKSGDGRIMRGNHFIAS